MLQPIKFNDENIFEPESWEESSEVIESISSTEAGTDQIAVTRYDKLSISCSFNCSHRWTKKFKEYSKMDYINVSIYDHIDCVYKTHTMRIRDFRISLVQSSWQTPGTNGLWQVSFTLLEF